MLAALVSFIAFFASAGIFVFTESTLFSATMTWLLSSYALYLVVLGLLVYPDKLYWTKPKFKINKLLKVGGLVPGAIIVFALVFMDNTQSISQVEQVTKNVDLKEGLLKTSGISSSPQWFV
jgi:hypothetical protein